MRVPPLSARVFDRIPVGEVLETMKLTTGDTVAYSAEWLRSTGNMTGDLPFARGEVRRLIPLGSTMLAEIDWNDDQIPKRVNVKNLSKAGRNTGLCRS